MQAIGAAIGTVALLGVALNWILIRKVQFNTTQLMAIHTTGARQPSVEVSRFTLPLVNVLPNQGEQLTVLGTFNERKVVNRQNFFPLGKYKGEVPLAAPPGTIAALPSISGIAFAFGELVEVGNGELQPEIVDHHLGLQYAEVVFDRMEHGYAVCSVTAALSDKNGDDKWAFLLVLTGLFLGSEKART
jgi:hypothetical protein